MEPTTALAIQDLVSCCVGSKRSLGNPVHKVRKSYRTIVSVIWLYEKKVFMNSVIADDSTGIAQPFNVRAQIERQDLIPQVSPCAAEMNDKTLERKPQHRASALRRPADYLLRFIESFSCCFRKVFRRLNSRKLGPDHIAIHPKRELPAVCARLCLSSKTVVGLEGRHAEVPKIRAIPMGEKWERIRNAPVLHDRIAHHLGIHAAMRASKRI